MSLLPRLLLARHLSRRAIQTQLQACIEGTTSVSSESFAIAIAEGPALANKPFTTSSFPNLKNNSNKHTARPPSAKPHVHSATANASAASGGLAAGQKVVVGTAGSSATPAPSPTVETPAADISKVNVPVHDTGAAQAAPIFGAQGSPTTKGLNSPPGTGGVGAVSGAGGPSAAPSGGGEGAGTILLLLAALGAGGGAYYYWDDLKGYLPLGPETTPKGVATAVSPKQGGEQNGKGSQQGAADRGEADEGTRLPQKSSTSGILGGKNGTGDLAAKLSGAAKVANAQKDAEVAGESEGKEAKAEGSEQEKKQAGNQKPAEGKAPLVGAAFVGKPVAASQAASVGASEGKLDTAGEAASEAASESAEAPVSEASETLREVESGPARAGGAQGPQAPVQALLDGTAIVRKGEEQQNDVNGKEELHKKKSAEVSNEGGDEGDDEDSDVSDESERDAELHKVLQEAARREGGEEETEASKKAKQHVHNLRRAVEEVEKRTSGQSESLAPESLILENIRKTHERAETAKREAEKVAHEALRKRQEEEDEEESGPFRRPSQQELLAAKSPKLEGFEELAAGVQTLAAEADRLKRGEFGYLGAKGDVAIGALIAEAVQEAVRGQAEADSEAFQREIAELHEEHRVELADARAEALRHAQIVHKLERDLTRKKAAYRAALHDQWRRGEEKRIAALQAALRETEALIEKVRTTAAAKAALTVADERKERAEQLDELRMQVNALQDAFSSRSREAQKSHTAHKLALGAFALEDALESGQPLKEEVRLLAAAVDEGDPLVMAALTSVPAVVAETGAPTRAELQERFEALQGRAKQLVLLPPGGGGMLAHALAWAASTLKVKEPAPQNGSQPNAATSDAALARAEALLAHGELTEVAKVLESAFKGTGAETLVKKWAEEARSRAVAEQAVKVVQAQATALAASLS
ncbi:hypothetical protein KFL_004790060 [Klebsormidium nitens]|uniref:MICOS complex subunit MIC60 n=1 Tax=Klebsormidium nitens TaxID=105231 RepID=A0A1Y1IEI0_KLENI|nr:hypothetical protein KFL_004790060 [Klebsormidium nitens]|eukprot:GAQ89013.1 hypothetical protein KFL_004790060 [Klebsormidium nitens]